MISIDQISDIFDITHNTSVSFYFLFLWNKAPGGTSLQENKTTQKKQYEEHPLAGDIRNLL